MLSNRPACFSSATIFPDPAVHALDHRRIHFHAGDGRPAHVISYYDTTNSDLKYVHATDAGGSDPHGPISGTYRIDRGGFLHYSAYFRRAAARDFIAPNIMIGFYGFRPTRSAVP